MHPVWPILSETIIFQSIIRASTLARFHARIMYTWNRACCFRARRAVAGRSIQFEPSRPTGACKAHMWALCVLDERAASEFGAVFLQTSRATLGRPFILNGAWHDLVLFGRKMRGRRVWMILVKMLRGILVLCRKQRNPRKTMNEWNFRAWWLSSVSWYYLS